MTAIEVWLVGRRRRGRKKFYTLRWEEPVLDERGQPVTDESGKVRYRVVTESCHTNDRVEAEVFRERKRRELNGLVPAPPPAPTDLTIEQLADMDEQWLRNRGRAAGTLYLSRQALETLQAVLKKLERTPLMISTITAADVESFISARREAKRKGRTINRELVTLRAVFNRAVKVFKVLKENPFGNLELVKLEERPMRVLSTEEIRKLLKACSGNRELDLYVRIGLETGCRADEISHLEWERLDLEQGIGQLVCSENWRTKARRNKIVAVSEDTLRRLKRWRRQRKGKRFLFAEEGEKPRGHYHHIARLFDDAVDQAGIAHCSLHDLRRTLGSRMAAEGINQRVAAEVLGHSDMRTTAKFYQAVAPETVREVILRLKPTNTTERRK